MCDFRFLMISVIAYPLIARVAVSTPLTLKKSRLENSFLFDFSIKNYTFVPKKKTTPITLNL